MRNVLHLSVAMLILVSACAPEARDATDSRQPMRGVDSAEAIRTALAADDVLGSLRNRETISSPIHEVVAAYVSRFDTIDVSGCPEDFRRAFESHRDSWEAALPFLSRYGEMRGEMHDVFDRIRATSGDAAAGLDTLEAAIWNSWAAVEEAAARAGVN